MSIRESGLSMLSKKIFTLDMIPAMQLKKKFDYSHLKFQNRQDLHDFQINGLPVGADIYSSLITFIGDIGFNPASHSELINKIIKDYMLSYETAKKYLDDYKFNLVYIFNGRFTSSKAWLRACGECNVEFVTHDRVGMPDRVLKIKKGTVHNPLQYPKLINNFWDKHKNNQIIVKEAEDFFEERPQGKLTGWFSFVRNQKNKNLPANWDYNKHNVVIFASTEGEFAGLPETFINAPFKNQKEAYISILKEVEKIDSEIHFFLRIHPNSFSEKEKWWEDQIYSTLKNLTIIKPDSEVSSYELLYQSNKIMVFGSTIGVEATYWGKPSIILSNAMYRNTGAAYEPGNLEEVIEILLNKNLPSLPREAALAYGAFIRCGVPKLPYSEALDHCTLTFKGKRPNASKAVLNSLWKWENYINKPWVPTVIKKYWEKCEFRRLSPHFTS